MVLHMCKLWKIQYPRMEVLLKKITIIITNHLQELYRIIIGLLINLRLNQQLDRVILNHIHTVIILIIVIIIKHNLNMDWLIMYMILIIIWLILIMIKIIKTNCLESDLIWLIVGKLRKMIKNKSSYKIKKKIIKLEEFNSLDWKIKDNRGY